MIQLIICFLYAVMRMFGGRDQNWLISHHIPLDNKLWKRIIAPTFLGVSTVALSFFYEFHWLYLLFVGTEIGSAFMDGYGNDSGVVWREIVQRILSALASTAGAIVLVLGSSLWWLLVLQLFLALLVKVSFNFIKIPPFKVGGVLIDSAVSEELCINFVSSVVKPWMIR